ncbi:EAL domain-containing protein [Marinobacterium weihaiense]|uniref:EAL domain-containing protein n=1 Tax=Marinobacterium weihaiense TaxID=2851016 RepID=A0ABS6M925_9GAMM|nr:EAL domain-containing protein [Marinobacterium weihaiense]MBV0932778.1 EAL domain-containing protein [Marinobacterium weihaiense]
MNNDNNEFLSEQLSASPERMLRLLNEQQIILDNAGVGICFILNRQVQRCNDHYATLYGYDSPAQIQGLSSRAHYPDDDSHDRIGREAYPILAQGRRFRTEARMQRCDGSLFWCRLTGKMVDPEDPARGSIWIVEDIDQQRRADDALKALTYQQQLILDHAMVGILFLHDRQITSCNHRFADMLGYEMRELIGQSTRIWYPDPAQWEIAGRYYSDILARGQAFRAEIQLLRKDGSLIWCDVRSKAIVPDDLRQGSIWIMMDISERKASEQALLQAHQALEQRVEERTQRLKQVVDDLHREIEERKLAEERIRHLAQHDGLTGLPNRTLFEQRLEEQIARAEREGHRLAVLFIDLDRFKHVNDSMGHHEGDMLLQTLAERLRQAVSGIQTVARMGGDEFVIMLPDIYDHTQVETFVRSLQQSLQPHINTGLHEQRLSCSTGIALFPDDGTTPQTLIQHADAAMYRAKANGRNRFHFYNPQLDREQLERVALENALFHALQHGEFELHYQPQVDIRTGRIDGAEALIRWNRPGHSLVSPGCFIPLAEECGLIGDIGNWVLEEACAQMQRWQREGIRLRVSVNLSALQLEDPGFCDRVAQILERHTLEPDQLELELTESLLMKHVDATVDLLRQLDRMGVHLSIDDFGTGYSSLSYLKRFPLDKLKIDQSFVREISIDQDDAVICRTIISMAENLNLKVTAEGVEQTEQLALLAEFGCHQYQGFLFSRPVPAPELAQLYRQSQTETEPAWEI